ncbi:hypothetical protein [Candidatus Gromoviella agglomerans]|uniref:hypothetical protein n=1 Tax=Candidatus Gromoviella agglomerans TaxID=2806609 RepID=UPI001E42DE0F|nr:hypothetical protein [Candidatus Gromoviella agglomerans]UFX98268.1 hypothetical protein Gromo_00151 [Candidatus Gromoviella agglomerans]
MIKFILIKNTKNKNQKFFQLDFIQNIIVVHNYGKIAYAKIIIINDIENTPFADYRLQLNKREPSTYQLVINSEITQHENLILINGIISDVSKKDEFITIYIKNLDLTTEENDKIDFQYMKNVYKKLSCTKQFPRYIYTGNKGSLVNAIDSIKPIELMCTKTSKKFMKNLCVRITAQWDQRNVIVSDVYKSILNACPDNSLITFTPNIVQKMWPQKGMIIAKKHLVIESKINANKIDSTIANHYSARKTDQIYCNKYALNGSLKTITVCTRPRKEILLINIRSSKEIYSEIDGYKKIIDIKLNNLDLKYDPWTENVKYIVNSHVVMLQKVYKANKKHISTNFEEQRDMWDPQIWQEDVLYNLNDVVEYENNRYICIANNTELQNDLQNERVWRVLSPDENNISAITQNANTFFMDKTDVIEEIIELANRYFLLQDKCTLIHLKIDLNNPKNIHIFKLNPGNYVELNNKNKKTYGFIINIKYEISSEGSYAYISMTRSTLLNERENDENIDETKKVTTYEELDSKMSMTNNHIKYHLSMNESESIPQIVQVIAKVQNHAKEQNAWINQKKEKILPNNIGTKIKISFIEPHSQSINNTINIECEPQGEKIIYPKCENVGGQNE